MDQKETVGWIYIAQVTVQWLTRLDTLVKFLYNKNFTAFEQENMLLLESCLQTCMTYTIAECTVNKLLIVDRRTVRNM
jgi:hypothetical protein